MHLRPRPTANRAWDWPTTSARSTDELGAEAGTSTRSSSSVLPTSQANNCPRLLTPHTSIPSTRLASARFSDGTTTAGHPSRLADSTDGNTPFTGRTRPSRASSPNSSVLSSRGQAVFFSAETTEAAKARSKTEPIFGKVAGDSASVSLACGQSMPQLVMAARTLSRDSCKAASGRPTKCTPGNPELMSASISTITPLSPRTATEKALPSAISRPPARV